VGENKMGTRGTFGFIVDGEKKIAYNHFDSYPTGLGIDLMTEIHGIGDIEILRKSAKGIEMVSEDVDATDSQREYCENHDTYNSNVNNGCGWYALLRENQGTIMPYIGGFKYMLDGSDVFGDEDYDCIINLDTKKFEVYSWGKLKEIISLEVIVELAEQDLIALTKKWESDED